MSSDCPVLCVLLLSFHKEGHAFHKDIIFSVRKFRISLWQYQAPYHVFMDPHHNQPKGRFSASCYFTSSVPLDRKLMENGSIWRVCFASKIKLNCESTLAKHYQNVTVECTLAAALTNAYLFLAGLDPWPLEPLYRNSVENVDVAHNCINRISFVTCVLNVVLGSLLLTGSLLQTGFTLFPSIESLERG